MRYNKTLSLGEILQTRLRHIVGDNTSAGLEVIKIIDTWHQLLGPVMSRYSSDERFAKGRLTVRINSSILRNDLFMQRTNLVRQLNSMLGTDKVKYLELL